MSPPLGVELPNEDYGAPQMQLQYRQLGMHTQKQMRTCT